MTKPAYAAVDWGTSSFRLWLMSAHDSVISERRSDEGMTTASKVGFSGVLEAHLQALQAPDELPVVVCGMAGARQGWVEAGYVDVPAPLPTILSGALRVPGIQRDVWILPGLSQRIPGAPDVMRGEETQLLGALRQAQSGVRLVCMPGTHSKWVTVTDGLVSAFSTYMTGELFDILSRHSVLAHSLANAEAFEAGDAAYLGAVENAFRGPERLSNLLFRVRSGTLLEHLSPTAAAARLSGTLIGLEIAGAVASSKNLPEIQLVASGRLGRLYEAAFSSLSFTFNAVDADEAVRQGLAVAARQILSLNS